jgi:hypothetical protein
MLGSSEVAAQLAASQEGLSSLKLVQDIATQERNIIHGHEQDSDLRFRLLIRMVHDKI